MFLPQIFELDTRQDERGFFLESFKKSCFPTIDFVQENHSYSHAKVLRGMHYQKGQAKLVRVISGKILDVVVDFNPESKTYLKVTTFILSGQNHKQLFIPDGYLHGFYAYEPTHLVYKVSSYYDSTLEGGICPFDQKLNIPWPDEKKILSQKDQSWPSINEYESRV